jgi:hypothetical protein
MRPNFLADLLRGVLTHPSIRTVEEAPRPLELPGLRLGRLIRRVHSRDSKENFPEFRIPLPCYRCAAVKRRDGKVRIVSCRPLRAARGAGEHAARAEKHTALKP